MIIARGAFPFGKWTKTPSPMGHVERWSKLASRASQLAKIGRYLGLGWFEGDTPGERFGFGEAGNVGGKGKAREGRGGGVEGQFLFSDLPTPSILCLVRRRQFFRARCRVVILMTATLSSLTVHAL